MWAGARCWIWAGSGTELKSMWPRFESVLFYLVYSWLRLGLPLAYLWPKFGKQERTAKMSYSSQYVGRSKVLDLGLIWARIKINVAQIWASSALFGLFMADFDWAFLWFTCGPNLANRSEPPKCYHSSQYEGRSKVLDLGQIWARIKINVAQFWASSALFGLLMADIGPSFGLLVAQIWQTGADRQVPSFHMVCGTDESVRCGPDLGLRNFAIWESNVQWQLSQLNSALFDESFRCSL